MAISEYQQLYDTHKITAQQKISLERDKTKEIYATNEKLIADLRRLLSVSLSPAEVADPHLEEALKKQQLQITQQGQVKDAQYVRDAGRAGEQAAAKFAEPFKQAFDQIGSSFESALSAVESAEKLGADDTEPIQFSY